MVCYVGSWKIIHVQLCSTRHIKFHSHPQAFTSSFTSIHNRSCKIKSIPIPPVRQRCLYLLIKKFLSSTEADALSSVIMIIDACVIFCMKKVSGWFTCCCSSYVPSGILYNFPSPRKTRDVTFHPHGNPLHQLLSLRESCRFRRKDSRHPHFPTGLHSVKWDEINTNARTWIHPIHQSLGHLPAYIVPYFPRDMLRFQPKFRDVLTCSWFSYIRSGEQHQFDKFRRRESESIWLVSG